ncbi:type II 3-dehydroquinate dehydratase [Portibacter marinus]|uniref:type II 3-dehydroquinate dehydratase n=1 Tax=Portibacter marinus TaxID=2898660 RepID=UPI001F1E2559|nr:type II 3-dehydroquinate dehydratase [Portibacter marinus]
MKIHIVNGPNLNLVGRREPEIYGNQSLEDYFETLEAHYLEDELHYFQSNHEGALLDYLHEHGFSEGGIILNAGALTHTSLALGDAIKGIEAPVVEVHISNVYEREKIRHHSFLEQGCVHTIVGQGLEGYAQAIEFLRTYQG